MSFRTRNLFISLLLICSATSYAQSETFFSTMGEFFERLPFQGKTLEVGDCTVTVFNILNTWGIEVSRGEYGKPGFIEAFLHFSPDVRPGDTIDWNMGGIFPYTFTQKASRVENEKGIVYRAEYYHTNHDDTGYSLFKDILTIKTKDDLTIDEVRLKGYLADIFSLGFFRTVRPHTTMCTTGRF